jgi:hypothetical protein
MTNLLSIIVYTNDKESSLVFDPHNSFKDLKKVISLSHNMPLESIEIFYRNKKVTNDDMCLYDVIGGETVPIFHVNPKSKNIYQVDKDTKNKYYSKKFLEEKKEFYNKIVVENYPSRAEIYTLLNGFAETNNILFDYTTLNRTNNIEICFKNCVKIMFIQGKR